MSVETKQPAGEQDYLHNGICFFFFCFVKGDSEMRQVSGFLRVLWYPPPIKLTATIFIAEILLIVVLNTTILNAFLFHPCMQSLVKIFLLQYEFN